MSVAENLIQAREILAHSWYRGSLTNTADSITPETKFCAVGALAHVMDIPMSTAYPVVSRTDEAKLLKKVIRDEAGDVIVCGRKWFPVDLDTEMIIYRFNDGAGIKFLSEDELNKKAQARIVRAFDRAIELAVAEELANEQIPEVVHEPEPALV